MARSTPGQGEPRRGRKPPRPAPTLRGHIAANRRDPQLGHSGCARELRVPIAPRPPGRRDVASGRGLRGGAGGWCPVLGRPSPGMRARWDLAAAGAARGEGRSRSAFPQDELELAAGVRKALGRAGGAGPRRLRASGDLVGAWRGAGGGEVANSWISDGRGTGAQSGRHLCPQVGESSGGRPGQGVPSQATSLQVGSGLGAPHRTPLPREAGLPRPSGQVEGWGPVRLLGLPWGSR